MAVLLGIDIGTSSSKGVLVDDQGTVLAQAERAHHVSTPRPGWFEHDPVGTWWADFVDLAGQLTAAAGDRAIAGVAVSGIGPCLLPADADGTPLRPAILYGVDTRAAREIREQTDQYGADVVLDRCGSTLTSQAIGPKLAWLRRHEPEVWQRTRRWFMASSYLVFRLTGEYVLDHHSASQSVPLYDSRRCTWIDDWCERIAPGLAWPTLVWPAEPVGAVSRRAAAETGIPAGTPVVAGTIDAWAEAVSVGATRAGDVMVMYGTTMFLVNVTATRVVAPTLWGTVSVWPGSHTLAAGMATSGAVTGWLRDLTGGDYATLVGEAENVPPGADGLLTLPYFAGERTPIFDPDARGVVAGLTLRHTRGHLYRSALEAVGFGVRHNLEAMVDAGGEVRRLIAVGGGTRGGSATDGSLWTRIVSSVTQRPQELRRETIGAAYGDAFLAAVGVGMAKPDDIATWNPVALTVAPDPVAAQTYDELYPLYRELYPATAPVVHALADRQRS